MERLTFSLQMYRGMEPPTRPVLNLAIPQDIPMWRCSHCLMGVRIYQGRRRPNDHGCVKCRNGYPSTQGKSAWLPVNRLARVVDAPLTLPSHEAIPDRSSLQVLVATVERAILEGNWVRLTASCKEGIDRAICKAVRTEMVAWSARHPNRGQFGASSVEFDYGSAIATVNCHRSMDDDRGFPHGSGLLWRVRYKWDQ